MPRNKYPEETKQKILEAAIKVFAEKGYEQSTILDIVAKTDGLTRGAFYHHFKSKEEVLNGLLVKLFYENNPFEKVMYEKKLNGLQKLRKAIIINLNSSDDETANLYDKIFDELKIASESLLKSPHFFAAHVHLNAKVGVEFVQPLIEEGIRDGSITAKNPRLTAELFVMLFSIWTPPYIFVGDEAYLFEKAELTGKIFESLGLPIFDEEFEEAGSRALHEILRVEGKANGTKT